LSKTVTANSHQQSNWQLNINHHRFSDNTRCSNMHRMIRPVLFQLWKSFQFRFL